VPAVHFVDGTIDYEGPEAVTAKGDTLRIVVVPTPDAAPCVVDVALAKPFKVTAKHCLDGAKLLSLVLSPRAAWVAWQANANATADVTWVRTMNLDSGEIGVDVATNPSDDILVTDTGRLVIDTLTDVRQIDPTTKVAAPVVPPPDLHACTSRGDRTLVCERNGFVTTVEL
jgi:hypothetical protein